jgi:dihydroorotase
MNPLYLYNATIVNEGRSTVGSLLVADGTIARIETTAAALPPRPEALPEGCRVIDATGQWLLPGVIDTHVHFREPGATHKADMASETRAAAAGGVTSFIDMPNNRPVTVSRAAVDAKRRRAADVSLINYSFYIGATLDNGDEIRRLPTRDVGGVKLFLGSSTGDLLVDDERRLSALFAESPVIVVAHCEDEALLQRNLSAIRAQYGDRLTAAAHPLIRSAEACVRSTERALTLASKYGARLHVLHVSTGAEAALFSGHGDLTGEACIAHLWFCDDDYARWGNGIKCNPAIKTAADRDALRRAVAEGRLTTIGTDHAPHTRDEKRLPYPAAPSGIPSIQYALPLVWELCRAGWWTPETAVERMCHAPARLFRIDRRGFIREGYHADLVLVDPARSQTLDDAGLHSKCAWSPYHGTTVAATVTHTFVNGQPVFENGTLDETVRGQALLFNQEL